MPTDGQLEVILQGWGSAASDPPCTQEQTRVPLLGGGPPVASNRKNGLDAKIVVFYETNC